MNDLPDLLDDASQPEGDWLADPHALLAEGRHRVRRRRLQFAAGAGAVVLLGATASAVVAPRLTAGPEPARPDDKHSSSYIEERLSADEIDKRCDEQLDDLRGDPGGSANNRPWVAGVDANGRAVPVNESVRRIENRAGRGVAVARQGQAFDPEQESGVSCTLSADGLDPRQYVDHSAVSSDGAALADACSRAVGVDIAGWRQAAYSHDPMQVQVVYVSDNGYAARCAVHKVWGFSDTWLYEERFHDDDGAPIVDDDTMTVPGEMVNRYVHLNPSCEEVNQWAYCRAYGMIWGGDARIRMSLPGGTVKVITAPKGAFSYSVRLRPADLPKDTDPVFPTTVMTMDGTVIWEGWQDQDK